MAIQGNAGWLRTFHPMNLFEPSGLIAAGVGAAVYVFLRSQSSFFEAQQRYLELQCDQQNLDRSTRTQCLNLKMIEEKESQLQWTMGPSAAIGLHSLAYTAYRTYPGFWNHIGIFA